MLKTEPDWRFVQNENMYQLKMQNNVRGANHCRYYLKYPNWRDKTYVQEVVVQFLNRETTSATITFRLNISPRISNVTKSLDATYTSNNKSDES